MHRSGQVHAGRSCQVPVLVGRTRSTQSPRRCTAQSPATRAAPPPTPATSRRRTRSPSARSRATPPPVGCTQGPPTRGSRRPGGHRPRHEASGTLRETPPISGAHGQPASAAASPRRRGSRTGRACGATAGRAPVADTTPGPPRAPRQSSPRATPPSQSSLPVRAARLCSPHDRPRTTRSPSTPDPSWTSRRGLGDGSADAPGQAVALRPWWHR